MIGLIGVFGETAPIRQKMAMAAAEERAGCRFHCGRWQGKPVTLAEAPMGKVPAALAAQILLERYAADLLIGFGSAGALDSRLRRGDILLVDEVRAHDQGVYLNEGFKYAGFPASYSTDGLTFYHSLRADRGLLTHARVAAGEIAWGERPPLILSGPLASGDQVIFAAEKKRWLRDELGALAVEMESAALAYVAEMNGVPWLSIRAISDSADEAAGFDFTRFIDYINPRAAENKFRKLTDGWRQLSLLLANPSLAIRSQRIARNVSFAAARAAAIVEKLIILLPAER